MSKSAGRREVVAVDVASPPDVVWSALRDPAQIGRWFGWDYDGLDAEIQQIFVEEAVEASRGDVRTLSWPDGDAIAVAPAGGGTHLAISRRARPGEDARAGGPDEIDDGWTQFAHQLRYALDRHPQGRRRTVAAIDLDAGPVGAGPVYRLGVAAADGVPVGGTWEVARTIGDQPETVVGGTIWYRSERQAGYAVDDPAGDALLVVQTTPVETHPPHGRVSLVMSTYGLDDDAFAEVERRWTAWWSGT